MVTKFMITLNYNISLIPKTLLQNYPKIIAMVDVSSKYYICKKI